MYGTFIGDIVGAPYEFDRGPRDKSVRFFAHPKSRFTDDSLLTVAIGEALMDLKKMDMDHLPNGKSKKQLCLETIKQSILKWCSDPDYAGLEKEYGYNFRLWLKGKAARDWKSFGSGAAMRVGPAGWLYDSLEETIEMAGYTAEVSHGHPEGIKGAQAVAAAIYLARTGHSKQEIRKYLSEQFGYNLITSVARLQKHNLFINEQKLRPMTQNESCQVCVPQAIVCFLESESYEDAIQNAISIGGDTDTIGAITGSMAEAFYGVPARLREQADSRLDDKMRAVARRFLAERSPLRDPVAAELASEQFDPLAEIERQAKSGDVNYSVFLEQLEQLAQVSEPGSLRRRFAEFALQAVRTGYPHLKTLFEERMAELQEDQRFVADLPTLQSSWAAEKSTRLIRTQQICDKVIAARKAMGDWPEEHNPPAPEQKAKKADKGKAPAPRKAPAKSTGQGKQDAEKHTTIIQAKNG